MSCLVKEKITVKLWNGIKSDGVRHNDYTLCIYIGDSEVARIDTTNGRLKCDYKSSMETRIYGICTMVEKAKMLKSALLLAEEFK
jgi:hypothetical protein